MNIYIYEDEEYENFLPLTYLKPVFDIRCGMFTFKERTKKLYENIHLSPISRFEKVSPIGKGLFINGRTILKEKIPIDGGDEVFVSGDEVVAFRGKWEVGSEKWEVKKKFLKDIKKRYKTTEVNAEVIKYPWELVAKNKNTLLSDYYITRHSERSEESQSRIQDARLKMQDFYFRGRSEDLYIGEKVRIYPRVFLNTENGPIYIGDNIKIRPPTIIDGPCYIGDGSLIDGAKIRQGTSIGKMCKIAGEVEETIFLDWSNKHHEGFVGHSYIGEWVNIGAGTTTSDLKNTYGTIKIPNPKLTTHNSQLTTQIDTGLIKLGAFIGDHTKTGIGTLFTTGSVIGIFCNIYGGGTFPKYIPSFSWGTKDKFTTYKLDEAIETAKICMSRRNVTPDSAYIERIKEIFKVIENERNW